MREAMKICFLIPGFSDGGAQKQCIKLLHALGRKPNLELHLIHFHDGIHRDSLDTNNITVHKLSSRSNYNPKNIIEAHQVIRNIKPDILFTWLHACDVYGFFLKKLSPRMRWIMAERDSQYPKELRYWIRRKLGRFADGIISNSTQGLAYWKVNRAKGGLFVASNIIDTTANAREFTAERRNAIIAIGRLETQKNPIALVESFCEMAKRRSDLFFEIIGDGSLKAEVEGIIVARGAQDRVKLLGFRRDAVELVSKARILVSLSHHEGAPNVVLESISVNTPIVASDISEHRAILGDSYPFFVTARGDPNACADTIEKVLSTEDPETSLAFGKQQLQIMTAESVSEAYMSIFERVLLGHRRGK